MLVKTINWIKKYSIHILAWLFYAIYEIISIRFVSVSFAPFWDYFFYYLFNISLFYIHANFLLLYQRKKLGGLMVGVIVIIEIIVYVYICQTSDKILVNTFKIELFHSPKFNIGY